MKNTVLSTILSRKVELKMLKTARSHKNKALR